MNDDNSSENRDDASSTPVVPQSDSGDELTGQASHEVLGTAGLPPPLKDVGPEGDDARQAIAATEIRFANLERSLAELAEKVAFVPPQIRMLASKVEGLAISVAEPRCRALLLNVVSLYDLVEQMLRATLTVGDAEDDHARNYRVLRSQIRQLLETNGLYEIDNDRKFDPELHRVIKQVDCDDAQQDGQIVEVIRSGFRTEHAVLRFAEVVLARYAQQQPESDG